MIALREPQIKLRNDITLKSELRKTNVLFNKVLDAHEKGFHISSRKAFGPSIMDQSFEAATFLNDNRDIMGSFHKAIKRVYSMRIKLIGLETRGLIRSEEVSVRSSIQGYGEALVSMASVLSKPQDYDDFIFNSRNNNMLLYDHFKKLNPEVILSLIRTSR